MKYRKEIDGLRAVAVLAVMAFHAGFQQFSGGYVGVDVFLVISGYLITTILLEDFRRGDFSIKAFYDRRVRRILPALFAVLAASTVAALLVLTPREMVDYSKSLVAVALFVANIFFWREGGYFDTEAELQPLLHTWSLALEEQYYILFPLLLLGLLRRCRSDRQVALLLGGVGLASFALGVWGTHGAPRASFFLLPARAWELLVGACLAAWRPAAMGRGARELAALAGVLLVGWGIVSFDAATPLPGVHALAPTLGAALIILAATQDTVVGRLLGSRLLVGIGLVSYSAYLWHQPLLAFARIRADAGVSLALAAGLCLGALVLGYASWRWVEQPFRRRGVWSENKVLATAAGGLGLFVLLGIAGIKTHGFEALYESRLEGPDLARYQLVKTTTAGTMYDDMVDDGACRFWSPRVTAQVEERFRRCTANGAKALVVLGDSHAMNIYNALARVQAAPVIVGFSQAGCHPYRPSSDCHYGEFETFAAAHAKAIDRVIYHQSGSYLVLDERGAPDKDAAFAKGAKFSVDAQGIAGVRAYLGRIGQGGAVKVTWLGPFLEPRRDMRDPRALERGTGFSPDVVRRFEAVESRIAEVPDDRYVPMLGRILSPGDALLQGDCLLFRDKDHLSVCGERWVGRKLVQQLALQP